MAVRQGNTGRGRQKKRGNGVLRAIFRLFVSGLFLLLVVGAGAAWLLFLPVGPGKETFVEILPGSSSNRIAEQLEQAHVIRSRYGFAVLRLWKRGTLKAGEYRFAQDAPAAEVYARIQKGDVFTVPLTIPEGSNRFEIAARVEAAGFGKKEDFLAAAEKDTKLIADLDPKAPSLEGYLFPDTYRFQRKATAAQILAAMVRRFRVVAAEVGLTPVKPKENVHDVVTLASLVERETAVNSERALVASVLTNRLTKQMPLMTDPAVIYGLLVEGKWRGSIYASDLAHDTPYNTYRHAGLPPGPIANPGLPALKAAVAPAATDYLYFVAAGTDPQGKSRFAATLEEHNKNVAAYRLATREAGGR
jgi:UPF0755 protein